MPLMIWLCLFCISMLFYPLGLGLPGSDMIELILVNQCPVFVLIQSLHESISLCLHIVTSLHLFTF